MNGGQLLEDFQDFSGTVYFVAFVIPNLAYNSYRL